MCSHFNPTNVDLVNMLRWRIEREQPSGFITDMHNLYEKEPWLLQHVRHISFNENDWFYFTRTKKAADSKRPSRKVGESGRWKTTSTWTQINNQDGVMVGSVKHFSFKAKSETVYDGITTGWVIHEFILEDKPGFQELVLCRIRFCKREDNAQYAARLTPIVIGLEQEDGVAAAAAPVETHQAQGMEQWTGSCSGEAVTYSAPQQTMAQGSNYPMLSAGGMEKHQEFGYYGQQHNHILGQMKQYGQGIGDMVEYQNQYLGQQQNHILGRQATYVSPSAQTMEEDQQQWNGYFGPYSAQPYDQGMMEQQDFGSSVLGLAQNDQYLGQNSELPPVPMKKTLQQHDNNVIRNSAANLQLEDQENVVIDFLMNEDFIELHEGIVGSPTDKELIQETESEMVNFGNEEWAQQLGQNTPEEEAELHAALANCETFESFLNFFCPTK
ncbi:hypothetical protein IGI04_032982 [Brassica rapa subsp. trilocularis]|uniref:NAC domain-containing protein n=1 Tax=Brassica rapa subsp. trilocularis TaxID=1813537 RepID=A0ABQ7L4I2_BRACM|nr:hypothetical protein IGI04_032982 [Brassica rapa subsp. trilocularis]